MWEALRFIGSQEHCRKTTEIGQALRKAPVRGFVTAFVPSTIAPV